MLVGAEADEEETLSHYSFRVEWSPEDNEYVGLCAEFPSLSHLAPSEREALAGIEQLVGEINAEYAEMADDYEINPPTAAEVISVEIDPAVLRKGRPTP
jgi:predicted RNase H-like HicB family nuclease